MLKLFVFCIILSMIGCGGGLSDDVDAEAVYRATFLKTALERHALAGVSTPTVLLPRSNSTDPLRALSLALTADRPTPSQSAEQLMDWAEKIAPHWFSTKQTTYRNGQFAVRYYPRTGIYLGVVTDTSGTFPLEYVYVLGGTFGPNIFDAGKLTNYITPSYDRSPNSYTNYKHIGLVPQNLPSVTYRKAQVARAYIDAGAAGRLLFVADQRYLPHTSSPQNAPLSVFRFYTQVAGNWTEAPQYLPKGNIGCLHPRKALVSDFNGDGKQDIFVACTGYDGHPYPGEMNRIILSQPDGTYAITTPFAKVGFFHGAAAADFNRDGKQDLIVLSTFEQPVTQVWLNNGDGTFVKADGYLPQALQGRGSSALWNGVEVADVDGDGFFDLYVGGPEYRAGATTVFINPGNNNFSSATPVILPAVANAGILLDIVVTGSGADRRLWVLRTGGPDNMYLSQTVQRVAWPSLQSTIFKIHDTMWVDYWIIPAVIDGQAWITTDDTSSTIRIPDR